eukprot:COSAG03_NODE_9910_length_686_cov_1.367973_1_plen_39_part_10
MQAGKVRTRARARTHRHEETQGARVSGVLRREDSRTAVH